MREVLLLSHELRTPLTVISGYLEMLDEDGFTDADRRRIRKIMREAVGELEETIEALIDRERRVTIAYGLEVPELINPVLTRSHREMLTARLNRRKLTSAKRSGRPDAEQSV